MPRGTSPAPDADGGPWRRVVDTTLDSPDDIREWVDAPVMRGRTYPFGPRSIVLLIAKA